MHKLGNALDEGKGKNKGRTGYRPDHALALAPALVKMVAEFVYNDKGVLHLTQARSLY